MARFQSVLLFCCTFISTSAGQAIAEQRPLQTHSITAGAVTNTYWGTAVTDRYRSLEQLSKPEVAAWIEQQTTHARTVLNSIPGRQKLLKKMASFDGRRKSTAYSLSITDSNRYFYLKRTPKDETGKLFFRDGFKGKETLLFDPESLSKENGQTFVVSSHSPSDDGKTLTISVSPNGSEDDSILIMDVDSGKLYPETIDRCRFASPSWTKDGKAFLYNRMRKVSGPEENPQYDSSTWLHRIGTDPAEDREIFSRSRYPKLDIDSADIPSVVYDKESGSLFGFVSTVDRRLRVYIAPLAKLSDPSIPWESLITPEDNIHDFAVKKEQLYFLTPEGAPRFKILKTQLAKPDFRHAETVVSEHPEGKIDAFTLTSDAMYYTLSLNGVDARLFRIEDASGRTTELALPFKAGSAYISSKGTRFRDLWVTIAGWSSDYRRYRFKPEAGSFSLETISSPASYPEYRHLVVEEIMAPSHDGMLVPLSLVYRKGITMNGKNPVLLYGYGAYGKSLTPFFSPSMLLWTANGGVLAIAHVRGGGERGDLWHTEGMKTTKPNSWKDFIGCAEYLVKNGYTRPENIAINGASAGGILVGMAMNERPDLFAAVIAQVGAMNPLRGEETPNGPVNVPEFGTVTIKKECQALIAMDPYLQITDTTPYPAALVTTGMNDPRVSAWQPAKFAARLQEASNSGKPVLFFADVDAGHGMGNTKSKEFEALADVLGFGLWQTGHPDFQPKK
ncbi:MAG: S9 family peptidase [Chlorobium sp.]|nr:S9 family peptidase [Chlorobium sp.]